MTNKEKVSSNDIDFKFSVLTGETCLKLFLGHTKSPCILPCKTFHTRSKFLSRVKYDKQQRFKVKLFFVPELRITTTDFVNPTLSSLLSEVRKRASAGSKIWP